MPLLKDKTKRNELRRAFYAALDSRGEPLPTAIKTLRRILAMDQQAFCQYVGISLSALRRIEQGHSNVTLATVRKVLEKFGFELNVVVRRREPPAS
jgi:DNA-binding transcriptional regulator YiaG